MESARRYFGERLVFIPVTREGLVEVEWLAEALRSKVPSLVGVMAARGFEGFALGLSLSLFSM